MTSFQRIALSGVVATVFIAGAIVVSRSDRAPKSASQTVSPVSSSSGAAAREQQSQDAQQRVSEQQSQSVAGESSASQPVISAAQLAAADGKNGNRCYVAVDGTVYEIIGSPKWLGGSHSPSSGQAYCGADMSDVIGRSPHGRDVLQQLTVVGTL